MWIWTIKPCMEKSKKPLAILVVLVLIVLVGAGLAAYLLVFKSSKASAILYKESGKVFYKEASSDYKEVSSDELEVQNQSFIKTEDGEAHVIFPDNSMMSLAKNTEVQLSFDASGININQLVGNTWHRVKKLGSNSSYSVETPTALATVRGTKFSVEVGSNEEANIYVIESIVEVGQYDLEEGKKLLKDSKNVATGKYAKVESFSKKQGFELAQIQKEKEASDWFLKNKEVDKKFDNGEYIRRKGFLGRIRNTREIVKDFVESESIQENVEESSPSTELETETVVTDVNVSGLYNIDSNSCIYVKDWAAVEASLKYLHERGQFPEDRYRIALNMASMLKDFCADGSLNEEERKKLFEFVNNNPFPTQQNVAPSYLNQDEN